MEDRNTKVTYCGNAYDKPDFLFEQYNMYLEVKEKTQRYNPKNWPIKTQGKTVFIMDEISVRRMMLHGVNTALLVRDNTNFDRMYFADLLTLTMMPRKRVNRPNVHKEHAKGKWLLDFRNFIECNTLTHLLSLLAQYSEDIPDLYNWRSECFGDFMGEEIPLAGTPRTLALQNQDVKDFTEPVEAF